MKHTFKAFIAICMLMAFVQAKQAMALDLLAFANVQEAQEKPQQPPEEMFFTIQRQRIDRTANLRAFFKSYNSSLEPYSEHFVLVADKYGLDYRLLPAISCVESTCGKFYIPSSNNPFGWGIYGNTVTSFESIEVGIDTVGAGLAKNYVNKGYDTVEEIAPIYNPNTPVQWGGKINFFFKQIDEATIEYTDIARL